MGEPRKLKALHENTPVNCPPPRSDAPFFATPVNSPPWIKRSPCQTILPVSDRESMYSVYYVVNDTGTGAIFKKTHTHIKNNIWYGNELSEYDTVQSTVLVDG